MNADREAEQEGANEYMRPEDVEPARAPVRTATTGQHRLRCSTEGDDEGVLAIDVWKKERPFAYDYVGKQAGNASEAGGVDAPDNLALDRKGNLVIAEDPPVNPIGADYFIAAPPRAAMTMTKAASAVSPRVRCSAPRR